jgi:hypothetical protein
LSYGRHQLSYGRHPLSYGRHPLSYGRHPIELRPSPIELRPSPIELRPSPHWATAVTHWATAVSNIHLFHSHGQWKIFRLIKTRTNFLKGNCKSQKSRDRFAQPLQPTRKGVCTSKNVRKLLERKVKCLRNWILPKNHYWGESDQSPDTTRWRRHRIIPKKPFLMRVWSKGRDNEVISAFHHDFLPKFLWLLSMKTAYCPPFLCITLSQARGCFFILWQLRLFLVVLPEGLSRSTFCHYMYSGAVATVGIGAFLENMSSGTQSHIAHVS